MASNSNSDEERDLVEEEQGEERDTFPEITNGHDEEERDTLPDLYENSDAGDLSEARSEGRSVTSEERSIRSMTPDTELEEIEEVLREQPKPKVIVFDLGK